LKHNGRLPENYKFAPKTNLGQASFEKGEPLTSEVP